MNTTRGRGMKSRRGQVIVLFAAGLVPAMVMMLVLTADVGSIFTTEATLQNGADAAALAAARVLIEGRLDDGLDEITARNRALDEATKLKEDNCPGAGLCVEFGLIDDAGDFVAVDENTEATAVRTRVARDSCCEAGCLELPFSGMFGMGETSISSQAIASLFANIQGASGLVPFVVRDELIPPLGEEMVFYPWDPLAGNFGLVNMDGESGGGAAELNAAIQGGGKLVLLGDGTWVDGETGIVQSIEKPMRSLIDKPILILIYDYNSYDTESDTGTNLQYHITGFLAATLTYVDLTGASGDSELRVRVEGIMTPEDLGVDVYLGAGGTPSPNVRKVALYQ